tara:strand:+ start:806 stop:2614 length:1809 start_codon:yes stop_codon:yes gene_type:complete
MCVTVLAAPASAIKLGQEKDGSALHGASLNINETFYYKYNLFLDDDPDDERPPPFAFHEFVNRTTVDLRVKKFSFGVQMDLAAAGPGCGDSTFREKFAERHGEDTDCTPPNRMLGDGWEDPITDMAIFQLEKVFAQYSGRNVNVQLGDYYAAFGRGIALSMVKKPEIDQDTSLRGVRFDLFTDRADWTLLGGITNPQQVSMELRNQGLDKTDWAALAGTSLKLRPHRKFEISLHGLGYELQELPSWSAGGTVGVSDIGSALDLFFEGDWFFYGIPEDAADDAPDIGHAFYATATVYSGPLTLLVETKRYKDAQHLVRTGPVVPIQYNNPPSLEHELSVTEDINGSIQSAEITGIRVQPELYFLKTNTTLTSSIAVAYDQEPHPPFSNQHELTLHPWIGLDQPIHLGKVDVHLKGDVGYRHDFPVRRGDLSGLSEEEQETLRSEFLRHTGLLHYSLDLGVSFGVHALELVSTYKRHAFTLEEEECWTLASGQEHCDRDDGWVALENALSYTLMGKYTAALHVDFTDDPIVQNVSNRGAVGNLNYDKEWRRSTYLGGEIILKPVSNLELYAFFGSQKSGVVCTGGACRTVPAFTGFKTRVSINF